MRFAWLALLLGVLLSAPAPARAEEGGVLPISIPEQMVNDALKGQTFAGEDSYETGLGEIPYTWKLSEVTFTLQSGYADIKATAEISVKGNTYKEPVTGKVTIKLQARSQKVIARLDKLTVPIYATVMGSKKKLGEVDLAAVIGPQEESIEPYLGMATAYLPKGTTARAKSLDIVPGAIKAEVQLIAAQPPATQPAK